jgi:hypothetical protein
MAYPANEDPDTQIDNTIMKLAEDYASCDRRSAEINDERATIRENAEKLGIPSKAFQHAVGMVKHMSKGERRDYEEGVARVLRAVGDRQADLFPEAAERIRKREEKAATKPRTPAEIDAANEANPRSDPNKGGAKPQTPPNPPDEQTEGDAALAAAAPKTTAKQSQSAKAKAKLAAAGLN